jgi:phage-related protein
MKNLIWIGSSLADLREFPAEARQRAGYELWRVQRGQLAADFKPLSDLGAGVVEIRIQTDVEHRVFYVARFPEAVYVLHACEKKTRRTSRKYTSLVRQRYQEALRIRRRHTDEE